MFADFHLHSHCSDGRLDPALLVDCVADAGVEVFALTDHDTTAGHGAARQRAMERALKFVPGIEMTTYAHGRVIHVLGLGCDGSNDELQAANEIAHNVWDANQCRWIAALARDGANIDLARDFLDHPVRLPVLIERLVRRGVGGGDPLRVHARFREFFSDLPQQAYTQLPTPEKAASMIRHCGGLALLAHPMALREAGLAETLLAHCDGLEAIYLAYGEAEQASLRALAIKHGKFYCGGSDYHGYFEAAYRPPGFAAPAPLLERLGL